MCGIAGIVAYNPVAPPVDREELRRIRDRMASRGPDGQGEWHSADERIGFGHRRLAIIDLSEAGAQPMVSADGQFVITFNGEIYNYRELRTRLEGQGYHFRTQSDTEVLLHLYAEHGADLVHELRGMYAFALWDTPRRRLLLARDPYGIKPLYVADDGRTLRFASQVKALLAGGRIDTTPEPAGHTGFFLWGHVPEPYTLYRGIRMVPPGTVLTIDHWGRRQSHTFWSVTEAYRRFEHQPARSYTAEERHDLLRTALLDSVRAHRIADVPVGVFLSSGLDSTTLAALASELSSLPSLSGGKATPLSTMTLAFAEYRNTANDEAPLAECVARHLGTSHTTHVITRDDFLAERARLLDAMDQPSIDGVNTYFVCKATRESGLKVALSGLGGDELFGGYNSFQRIPAIVRRLTPLAKLPEFGLLLRRVMAPLLANPLVQYWFSPKYAGLLEYGASYAGAYLLQRALHMPWELPYLMEPGLARQGWQELQTISRLETTTGGMHTGHFVVSALESSWYMRNQLLRDADWASMAHGLELRVPLVDHLLLEALAPLRGVGKLDMARTTVPALPEAILKRPKTGFSVPVQDWMLSGIGSDFARGYRRWARYVYDAFKD